MNQPGVNQPGPEAVMLPGGSFADRAILITGGGTGLGRAMGEMLLQLGANLVICGRREELLQSAAEEMQASAQGGQVLAHPCDVRDPEQVESLLSASWEKFGRLDALVNNAAGNFICPTERLSTNAFNSVVGIVLHGTANCTLAMGKRWIAEKTTDKKADKKLGGVILNIVTTYAWTGSGYVAPSAVAKAGVLALTRSLASEWAKYGVRSNAIAPGPFPTEGAWSRLIPPQVEQLLDPAHTVPPGRVGEHHELANLAAYLLSDFSAYINGECVTIDGGQWLRGAGQFNPLEALTPSQWDELQAAMRTKKK